MEHIISASLSIKGSIMACPVNLLVGTNHGQIMFCGTLQWGERQTADIFEITDYKMQNQTKEILSALLPDKLPGELRLLYDGDNVEISVQNDTCLFKTAKRGNTTAVLFEFSCKDARQVESIFLDLIHKASEFFGIQQFIFYAQSGIEWIFPKLLPDSMQHMRLPDRLNNCDILSYAHIEIKGNSVFCKAVNTLFGLRETDLFVATGKNGTSCMIKVPEFKTSFMESRDMYLELQQSNRISIKVKGSFIFSFISNMVFHVDSGVSENAFELNAFAHTESPIKLFGPFSIGDTCLMIKVSQSLEFGMYTSLYIKQLQFFAAVMLQVQGEMINLRLISAAVSDLSIPSLLKNLMGNKDMKWIDVLGFIQIMGLPFQNMELFDQALIEQKDKEQIVRKFNMQVSSKELQLDASQVQLTAFGEGMDLADLKRMRHYYISNSGNLQLTAQFYYATVRTTMGNYQIEPGLFICGVVEIFKKRFEVLFSYKENEGILAYAKIPSMDLGFAKIGPSQAVPESEKQFPLGENNVISQFMNVKQPGIVFFLSAVERDVCFYLDGRIELLSLFVADARIIFCSGLISIDFRLLWLGFLQISLHLKVAYNTFTNGGFEFCLIVDTTGLKEKLTAVTRKIDEAIQRLRAKINNATREIDRAQAHVNELYGQIDSFNRRIEDCRRAIRQAKWWKRAFVAIAKGIEIGAYEVAKVGVYAAIGVATAALQVAKGFIAISGAIGEGVMKAVNGLIQGAMSLFFINYIRLDAKADLNERYFQAAIEFVALGKTYRLNKTMGIAAIKSSPEKALSDQISSELDNDLNHIEDGAFRSNWRKYKHENYTIEQQCRRMDEAKQYMDSSIDLMQGIQKSYVREFNTSMSEFDEMNVSLMEALDDAQNVFSVGAQAGDISLLAHSMGALKRSVRAKEKKGVFRDEELKDTKELIAQYDEARLLYDRVKYEMNHIEKKRASMEKHQELMHKKSSQNAGTAAISADTGDIAKVMEQVEEQLYEKFPVDRSGKVFINLSREPLIHNIFAEADKEIGREPGSKVKAMRSRSRKGAYVSRL